MTDGNPNDIGDGFSPASNKLTSDEPSSIAADSSESELRVALEATAERERVLRDQLLTTHADREATAERERVLRDQLVTAYDEAASRQKQLDSAATTMQVLIDELHAQANIADSAVKTRDEVLTHANIAFEYIRSLEYQTKEMLSAWEATAEELRRIRASRPHRVAFKVQGIAYRLRTARR